MYEELQIKLRIFWVNNNFFVKHVHLYLFFCNFLLTKLCKFAYSLIAKSIWYVIGGSECEVNDLLIKLN